MPVPQRKVFFFIIVLLFPCVVLLVLEIFFRLAGVNEDFRHNNPSSLIRDDYIYLFRVRSHLNFNVPRFANLDQRHVEKGLSKIEGFYRVVTDAEGFREEHEVPREKEIDEFRIICLGDSVTFGWGSDNDKTYPALLEQKLDSAPQQRIRVVNSGQPGFNSYQCYLYCKDFLKEYAADLVIVACGHNDHHLGISGYRTAREKVLLNTRGTGLLKLKCRRSDTFLLLERLMSKLTGKIALWLGKDIVRDMVQPGSVLEYSEHLALLIEEIRSHGGQCLLLTEPRTSRDPVTDSYNHALLELGKRVAVPVIDVVPLFDRVMNELAKSGQKITPPNALFWDDVHPTPRGNEMIATAIAEYFDGPGKNLLPIIQAAENDQNHSTDSQKVDR